jgi:hypothetical protein
MTSNAQNQNAKRIEFLRKAGNYLLGYLLYTAAMLALLFLIFRIDTDMTLILCARGDGKFQVRGITNWTVFGISLIMLAGFVISEDRLRKAMAENRMWKVLLRIYLVSGGAWALWECIYQVAIRLIPWLMAKP